MLANFCIVLFIRLLFHQQARSSFQTSVNDSSVMCGRHDVVLLGNLLYFTLYFSFVPSFLYRSSFAFCCLFYVLCFTFSSFLPVPRFFILWLPYSLPLFSLPYSFLPLLFFHVHVPAVAFSYFLTHFCPPYFMPFFLLSSFIPISLSLSSRLLYLRRANAVQLHLSGLIGTANRPNNWIFLWKIRYIGSFKVRLLLFTVCTFV